MKEKINNSQDLFEDSEDDNGSVKDEKKKRFKRSILRKCNRICGQSASVEIANTGCKNKENESARKCIGKNFNGQRIELGQKTNHEKDQQFKSSCEKQIGCKKNWK